MKAINLEKRKKLITLPNDVVEHLTVIAKENKTNLKHYIEDLLTEVGRKSMLRKSSEIMLNEYKNNSDLTAFTNLDTEDYYEAK